MGSSRQTSNRLMLSLATVLTLGLSSVAVASPNAQGQELHRMFGRTVLPDQTIEARQVSEATIPVACREICAAIIQVGTCTPELCCTNDFVEPFIPCFICVADAEGVQTDFAEQQIALGTLTNDCRTAGFEVDDFYFPGWGPGNTPTPSASTPRPTGQSTTRSFPTTPGSSPSTTVLPSGAKIQEVGLEDEAPQATRVGRPATQGPQSNSRPNAVLNASSAVFIAATFSASLLLAFL
ncbi:hypothetical protein FA15DRAFT_665152 [Coprinopsis marcescibilis]|uniref:Extracellular membrane protein CFEM domain-containing protein n=1 Tax=Coprinopsis marcescibilis TaxID=230819 RepID=A0A5C3L6R3_COPMA|nr:hypothetical protein FA15DRAFT_665152 [Coprinopsis marcescibilis]